jgi:hypothetical protein
MITKSNLSNGLGLVVILLLGSCVEPVLQPDEYTVVDTLKISKNGFNQTLGYDVIIKLKQDSTLHYSHISKDGTLTQVSVLPLKPDQWKK